jgi:hypothetical protein
MSTLAEESRIEDFDALFDDGALGKPDARLGEP